MNKDEGECRCQIQRTGNKSTEENTLYHKGYIIPEKQPHDRCDRYCKPENASVNGSSRMHNNFNCLTNTTALNNIHETSKIVRFCQKIIPTRFK